MEKDSFKATLKLVDDKVKFIGKAGNNSEITLDYFPPVGNGSGYSPLEMFLLSLTECMSIAVLMVLRGKMKKTIKAFSANASGIQKDEHPKSFSKIEIEFVFESDDLDDESVKNAIFAAEDKICAVGAMIKGNVETSFRHVIKKNS